MSGWTPDQLWIERGEEDSPTARRVRAALPEVPVTITDDLVAAEPRGAAAALATGKRRLVLQRHRGEFLQHCPAGTPGLVCCNYLVINLGANCPYDCSYCFLQEYVANNPALKVFTNPHDALAEIDTVVRAHPERPFRIGTGELTDSLALDAITGHTLELVPFFAARSNATLELKTKSTAIDNLLRLGATDRVVVSWSVNAPAICADEDLGTAPLADRLAAARRVQAAGYRVGFHFDPLIEHPGWAEGYREAITMIAGAVDPRRIAWISMGSLRLSPGLRAAMRTRERPTRVLAAELVPTGDGKARVWRGLRAQMYRTIDRALRETFPTVPTYLCMEPPGVWQHVRGETPSDREVAQRLAVGGMR